MHANHALGSAVVVTNRPSTLTEVLRRWASPGLVNTYLTCLLKKNPIQQQRGGGEEEHVTAVPSLKRCFYGEWFGLEFGCPAPPSMVVLEIRLLCELTSTFTDKMVRLNQNLDPHTTGSIQTSEGVWDNCIHVYYKAL